jgi:hypothetical protein
VLQVQALAQHLYVRPSSSKTECDTGKSFDSNALQFHVSKPPHPRKNPANSWDHEEMAQQAAAQPAARSAPFLGRKNLNLCSFESRDRLAYFGALRRSIDARYPKSWRLPP